MAAGSGHIVHRCRPTASLASLWVVIRLFPRIGTNKLPHFGTLFFAECWHTETLGKRKSGGDPVGSALCSETFKWSRQTKLQHR